MSRRAIQEIFRGKVYESETIQFMEEVCGSGDIIHAGTFFGDFLPPLARACEGRVWAFEPNPVNYRCAVATVAINGLSNVELQNAALGATNGNVSLAVRNEQGRALGGNSTIIADEARSEEAGVKVPVAKIDDVVPEDRGISVLQLDVEGYEQKVLSGALETIERCSPVLIVERLPEERWLEEKILSLGYEYSGKVCGNTILVQSSQE